jgi:hypothetical protein
LSGEGEAGRQEIDDFGDDLPGFSLVEHHPVALQPRHEAGFALPAAAVQLA